MDTRQLHCFTLVAHYLSFSEAAKHLSLNQSTVSYQIAELERQLDMKLFERDRHGVSLTPSGEVFAREVGRILGDLNEAVNRAWMARSGVAGSLSLGFLSSMERVLGDVVRRFSVAHPNLSLGLEHPSMQAFNEGIRSGQLDAGVTFSFGLEPFEGLRQHRLCQEEVAAILPIGHPLSERPHLHISDLKGFPMVAMSPSESGTLAHAWISERFQRRGFSPDIVRRTSNFETLLFLIESGLGIGFLTRQSVEYYSHFKLLARPLEDEDLEVDVVLAWRSDNRNPALPLFLREFGIENLHAFMDKLH